MAELPTTRVRGYVVDGHVVGIAPLQRGGAPKVAGEGHRHQAHVQPHHLVGAPRVVFVRLQGFEGGDIQSDAGAAVDELGAHAGHRRLGFANGVEVLVQALPIRDGETRMLHQRRQLFPHQVVHAAAALQEQLGRSSPRQRQVSARQRHPHQLEIQGVGTGGDGRELPGRRERQPLRDERTVDQAGVERDRTLAGVSCGGQIRVGRRTAGHGLVGRTHGDHARVGGTQSVGVGVTSSEGPGRPVDALHQQQSVGVGGESAGGLSGSGQRRGGERPRNVGEKLRDDDAAHRGHEEAADRAGCVGSPRRPLWQAFEEGQRDGDARAAQEGAPVEQSRARFVRSAPHGLPSARNRNAGCRTTATTSSFREVSRLIVPRSVTVARSLSTSSRWRA